MPQASKIMCMEHVGPTFRYLERQRLRNFQMTNMDPGTNPPRYQRESTNYTGWIIGAVAALAVIGAIAYGMSDHGSTDAGRTTRACSGPIESLDFPRACG